MKAIKITFILWCICFRNDIAFGQMHKADKDTLESYFAAKKWMPYFNKLRIQGDSAIVKNNSRALLKELEPYLLKIKGNHDSDFNFMLRKAFTQLASKYNKLGDYRAALKFYLKAHELVDDKFCLDDWAWYVENEIANIYMRLDDFEKAEYFGKLCETSLIYYGKKNWLCRLYTNTGILFKSRNDFTNALNYYEKGLKIAEEIKSSLGVLACSNGIGEIYTLSGKFNEADDKFRIALKTADRIDSLDKHYNENKFNIHWSLAKLYRIRKDSIKAINEFNHSLHFMKRYYQDTNRREFAKIYLDISKFYFDFNNIYLSENFLNRGIQALLPDFKTINNAPLEKDLYQDNTFTDLFLFCSDFFYGKYKKNENTETLKNAILYLDLGLYVNDKIRNSLLADPSKLIQIASNKKLVDRGIQYLWEMQKFQKQDSVWRQARIYFNYSKALLLNEKSIHLELLNQLNEAEREKLKKLEEQELELQGYKSSNYSKDSINQALFHIHSKIKDILYSHQEIASKIVYPQNYIEYNIQDTFIYVMASLRGQAYFEKIGSKIEFQNIYKQINEQLLDNNKSNKEDIFKKGYQFLLGFAGDNLPEKICIIPDGMIQFIPFDILKKENGEYLINSNTISYSNSYGQKVNEMDYSNKSTLIYAARPSYPNRENEIISLSRGNNFKLLYTDEEMKALKELYGNRIMIDSSNNKFDIIANMRISSIVHYAGHAQAKGDSAYLILPGDDNKLDMDEIKSFKNPLKMIVLSACETGLGEWEYGEGIRSIGKSFQESGAESVVMSLWSVNDESTAKIMGSFYRNLEKGLEKDVSLRNAKLEYIKNVSLDKRHAYYWAGFVALGDMSVIADNSNNNTINAYFTIGIGIILIIFLLYFIFLKI